MSDLFSTVEPIWLGDSFFFQPLVEDRCHVPVSMKIFEVMLCDRKDLLFFSALSRISNSSCVRSPSFSRRSSLPLTFFLVSCRLIRNCRKANSALDPTTDSMMVVVVSLMIHHPFSLTIASSLCDPSYALGFPVRSQIICFPISHTRQSSPSHAPLAKQT